MGVRILEDRDYSMAAIYCSVVEVAFGPMFHDSDTKTAGQRAQDFLDWLQKDARTYNDKELIACYSKWITLEEQLDKEKELALDEEAS